MPPGSGALAFASRWFDPHTVATVFDPLIADWQREWLESSSSQRPAVWISGASAFTLSILSASPHALLAPWPSPGVLRRILTRVTLWTLALSMFLTLPFFMDVARRLDARTSAYLLVLLLPSSISIALPFAWSTVMDVIRSTPHVTRLERLAALRCGVASLIVMVILNGWAFPAANQQYRITAMRATVGAINGPVLYATRGPARGLRELSVIELAKDQALRPKLWPAYQESWRAAGAESVMRELSSRFSIALLPLVLMWMRWRALRLPRHRWYSSALPPALAAPLLFGTYMFLRAQERAVADVLYLPRWSGPWLALAVMIVVSLSIDRVRRVARIA